MNSTLAFLLLAGMTLLLLPLGFAALFILLHGKRSQAAQAGRDAPRPRPEWRDAERQWEDAPESSLNEWKIARLERRIGLVMAHLGIEDRHDPREASRDLLRSGKKIQAIRSYRAETGAGLKEAKAEIEALERELREGQATSGG